MFFSGVAKAFQCPSCEKTYSSYMPTSIFPIFFVVIASSVIWMKFFDDLTSWSFLSLLVGLLFGIGTFLGAFSLVSYLSDRTIQSGKCPQCGTELFAAGGGFIDGGAPSAMELIIYLLSLALPLVFALGYEQL
ncbi:MAG: hypothetical protein KDD55_06345 [Bdellovibrionales bacterium]|nr:hypothetical protein [Bdellovibrionales bacterium]